MMWLIARAIGILVCQAAARRNQAPFIHDGVYASSVTQHEQHHQSTAPSQADAATFIDLSSEQLATALDPDTSPFWAAMADGIRARAAASKHSHSGNGVSVMELHEGLAGEHHLLQRMLGRTPSTSESQMCGGRNATAPAASAVAPALGDATPGMSPSGSSRWDPFYKALREFKSEVWDAIMNVGRSVKDWSYSLMKWDLAIPFFGSSSAFLPKLGFKCQPMRACLEGFLEMPKALFHLVLKVGRGIWKLFKALVQAAAFREGGSPEEPVSDDTVEIPVDINETELEMGQVLFTEHDVMKDACIKNLRFKGSIQVDSFWAAKIKLAFATVSLPIEKWTGEITTCVRKFSRQFRDFLVPEQKKRNLHTRYFTPGNCNPHSVGLCMMLEKTRQCGIKLQPGGKILAMTPTKRDHMLRMCTTFNGVKVALTKVNDKVRCAEAFRLQQEAAAKRNITLDSKSVTTLDLEFGCQLVANRLQETRDCEPPGSAEEAFLRCRRLYGCTHQRPPEPTLLRWEEYVGRVMDTVTSDVRMRHDLGTSKDVAQIIETVENHGSSFQARVDDSIVDAEVPELTELDPKLLFTHSLWQDVCFEGLDGTSAWSDPSSDGTVWDWMHAWKVSVVGHSRAHRFHQIRKDLFDKHVSLNSAASSEEVTITLHPGVTGFFVEDASGVVADLLPGGQAASAGVQVGWIIRRVDGASYGRDVLLRKEAGETDYTVTFITVDRQPFFYRLSQALRLGVWNGSVINFANDWCETSDLAESPAMPRPKSRSHAYAVAQFLVMGTSSGWGIHFENDLTEMVLETPGWVGAPTKLRLWRRTFTWRLAKCEGSLCGNLVPGQKLRSLRVTISSELDAEVTKVCLSAAQLMATITPLATTFTDGEHDFQRASEILKSNAEKMAFNEQRQDDWLYPSNLPYNWLELGSLMGQTHYEQAVDPSRSDDPFEELNRIDEDEYFIDRNKDGRRNKLALFLHRRQWSLVQSVGGEAQQQGPELRLRGGIPSAREVRDLAGALTNPRRGAVLGAGIALHDLAIDLLSGLGHVMFYKWASEVDKMTALNSSLAAARSRSPCSLALVNVEFDD